MEKSKWEAMVKQRNTIYLKKLLKTIIKMKGERNINISRDGINLNIKFCK